MRSTHSAARAKKLKVMATPSIEVQEAQTGRQRTGKSSIGAAGGSSRHRMNRDEYELIIGKNFIGTLHRFGRLRSGQKAPPPALADGGLPDDEGEELADGGLSDNKGDEEDVRNSADDGTQPSVNPQISKMKEPIVASQPYVVTDKVTSDRTRSSLQHPEEDNNNRTWRNEGKGPSGHKSSLIHVYEESVREKTQYRKAALAAKESFREAMLIEKRMARAQKERIREVQDKESSKRVKVDCRAALLTELSKAGKSLDEIRSLFELLDSVEKAIDDVPAPSGL
ncbi:hypothetical protein R1flu_005422 [Riccia fluitans]|uniref:Uncharacterized protein n=1 Tax=Riccia fluitans TaxID=41844 RepID=A0ABD1YTD6_9MARC